MLAFIRILQRSRLSVSINRLISIWILTIQNEILSATRAAFENNLLILAFTNTSHGPDYTAPSNIFSPMNAGQFKQTLKEALGNRDFLSHLLDRQREHAHVATPEDYKKVIG